MAVLRPDLMMKNVVPVIMAGIIAVSTEATFLAREYDLIVSYEDLWPRCLRSHFWKPYVFNSARSLPPNFELQVSPHMPLYTGFVQLGAGLSVGLSGLAAGFAIGIVGDAGVRGTAQQPRLFVGMVC
jgi:V-type H+-transporting ATPase 16kDa proteolipid subunit